MVRRHEDSRAAPKMDEDSLRTKPYTDSERRYPKLSDSELAKAHEDLRQMFWDGHLQPATSEGLAIVPIGPNPNRETPDLEDPA